MSTTNPERTLYECFTLRIRDIKRDNHRSYLAHQHPQFLYSHLRGSAGVIYRRRKTMEYMEWIRREEPEYWEELQEAERRSKNPAYNDKRWSEGNDLNNWIRNNRTRRFQTSLADLDGLDQEEEETLQRERMCQIKQAERSGREWLLVVDCVFDILRLRVNACLVTTHTHF
jgi:hypothetical protein